MIFDDGYNDYGLGIPDCVRCGAALLTEPADSRYCWDCMDAATRAQNNNAAAAIDTEEGS